MKPSAALRRAQPCRLLVAAILTLVYGVSPARAQSTGSDAILVMPLDNVSHEAKIHWLQEGSALLLADGLGLNGVNAIGRTERLRAFEQLHLPAVASLSHATVIKVGLLAGAAEVVVGTLDLAADTLTVRARSIRLETGRMKPEIVESGPLPEIFAIFERVATRLAGAIAPGTQGRAGQAVYPPLEAFENYIKGLIAEAPATQVGYLELALKLQPEYERARVALWEARTEQGEHAGALAAVAPITPESRFARRARFLTALSRLRLNQYDDAFAVLKGLLDAEVAAPIYNNLGVVQIRRGWTAQSGRPTYYFNKAVQTEHDDPDYYFNLGYAYWIERDPPAAVYWLREAVRRDPADGDAHFVLGAALQATGNPVEATRERELARRLSSKYAEWERRPGPADDPVPRGLERIKPDLQTPRSQRLDAAIVSAAQREQRELAAFHLDRGRRLFEEQRDREAIVELRRSIFLVPYQTEPHLLLGRIYLRTGRALEAIDALKISIWSDETVAAQVALGEAYLLQQDREGARGAAERALALDPASPEAKALLARVNDPSGGR